VPVYVDDYAQAGDVPVVRRADVAMRYNPRDPANVVHSNPPNRRNSECIRALNRGWAVTIEPVTCMWCVVTSDKKGTHE